MTGFPPQHPEAEQWGQELLPEGTRLGPVHLAVTDAERALQFWNGVLGLSTLGQHNGAISLGTTEPVIVIHPGANSPVARRRTGLYHVALHIPTRLELARAIARLFSLRYPNSPTDHLVSETTYLSDPDGNGIELTLETPDRGTFVVLPDGKFAARTHDGQPHSGREPVNLESLIAELPPNEDLSGPLQVLGVHHVHLHVSDLEASRQFYQNLIGLKQLMDLSPMQMLDFGLNDHNPVHTLAINTWSGVGAPPPPEGSAGLRRFTLQLPYAEALQQVAARLASAEWTFEEGPEGLTVLDPSGNRLILTT